MARPVKQGLDYFPLDVDFDTNEKTEAIMGEFGAKGSLIFIYLLAAIYRKGYYLRWTELAKNQLANRVSGATGELVQRVLDRLVAYGVFDEELFNSDEVLTSRRIQDTYLEATKRRKLQEPLQYAVNVCNNPSSEGVNVDINTQSKVNKSKLNKTKPSRAKSAQRTFAPDSEELQAAQRLWAKITANNPETKEPNLQRWADDLRLMHERDNRSWDKINRMIKWSQADVFWSGVILSPKKLREKYDQMAAKANAEAREQAQPKSYGKPTRVEAKPDWLDNPYQPSEKPEDQAKAAEIAAKLAKLKEMRRDNADTKTT